MNYANYEQGASKCLEPHAMKAVCGDAAVIKHADDVVSNPGPNREGLPPSSIVVLPRSGVSDAMPVETPSRVGQ
jgi:hypothetical protein